MKKYVCLLMMFLVGSTCLKAQEVLDTMYLFCQYKAQTIKLTAQKKNKGCDTLGNWKEIVEEL